MKKKSRFRLFTRPKNTPKRDEQGRSQRCLCLEEFDKKKSWQAVAKEHGIKPTTCRRYYYTWKKLPERFEERYREIIYRIKDTKNRHTVIKTISKQLGITPMEVEQILQRSWGLKSLLLACYGIKKMEVRLSEREKAALKGIEQDIWESGRSFEDVILKYEIFAAGKEKILEMTREKLENKGDKDSKK